MGVPDTLGKGEVWGRTSIQNMQLQIVVKSPVVCCHLANTNEELGGLATAISLFAKLLWSLLSFRQIFDIFISTLVRKIATNRTLDISVRKLYIG